MEHSDELVDSDELGLLPQTHPNYRLQQLMLGVQGRDITKAASEWFESCQTSESFEDLRAAFHCLADKRLDIAVGVPARLITNVAAAQHLASMLMEIMDAEIEQLSPIRDLLAKTLGVTSTQLRNESRGRLLKRVFYWRGEISQRGITGEKEAIRSTAVESRKLVVKPNVYEAYPKCKYHLSGKTTTVKGEEEEMALGGGWGDSPADFDAYKCPRANLTVRHDPVKWVDEWRIDGLSISDRNKIKAQLWRVDSEFWNEADAPLADVKAMRTAFDGVASLLSSAGILTEQMLLEQIPTFIWDSAIAATWWRLASETPQGMFPEKLGHYWVWREEGKDWEGLFRSETAKWRAQLLDHSSGAHVLEVLETTPGSAQLPSARKRGRPAEISIGKKEAALAAQKQGASRNEIAKILYHTKLPTRSQINNGHNILKNFLRSLKS